MARSKMRKEINKFLDLVGTDVLTAVDAVKKSDTQYNRRVLVRAVFAAIEAMTFVLKQECLNQLQPLHKYYTSAEIALLKEESYSLNDRAKAVTRVKFLPTAENFRFALQMFMRAVQPDFQLELKDDGWTTFKRAFKVRHRVVHPKRSSDFDITDDELELVRSAYGWFNKTIIENLLKAVDILYLKIKRSKSKMDSTVTD